MERKKINVELYLNILFLVLILMFCLWNIGTLNRVKVIDDEFGYWGIAAAFAGYDWYDLLSITAYYSFGYSIILMPLMLLGKIGISMAVIYKLAIILNALFMIGQYLLILYVIRELEIPLSAPLKQVTGLFLTLYIGNVTQMDVAWSETYLCFMFWCIMALLIRTMKRRGYLNVFLLIAATANIFAIHMRAVGVVIAVIIVLAGWLIGHYKECGAKYIGFVVGMSGLFALIVAVLKSFVSNHIYMGGNINSGNDIAANINRTRYLLSASGIIDVIMSVLGKLYYAGSASFLLTMVGLVVSVVLIIKALFSRIKNGRAVKWQAKEWMLLFMFLAFMGEIGVSALFKCFRYYSSGATNAKADTIVYGRYADFVMGSAMLLGIWAVCRITEYYREVIVAILFFIICSVSVQKQLDILSFYNGGESLGFRGTGAPWLSFLYQGRIDNFAYYAAGVSMAIFACICLARIVNMRTKVFFSMILVAISLFWGIWSIPHSKQFTVAKSNKEKTVITVKEIIDTVGEDSPVYMVSRGGTLVDVKILQWCMGTQSIHMLKPEEVDGYDLTQGIYLADSSDMRVLGVLSDRMDYVYDSGTIAVFVSADHTMCREISDKAVAMGQVADPSVKSIDLAEAATELAYRKENGSLYYNYQATDGGYMTWETGVNPEDGIYEFEIDIRARGAVPDNDIGFITVGSVDGGIQDTYIMSADDFAGKDRQIIPVRVTIQDRQEPVIGVYTHGEASVRIYGISYHKIVGSTMLNDEEWADVVWGIQTQNGEVPLYYVDSDRSGFTGFPYWETGNLKYLSGPMMHYKETFEKGYYLVEKTDVGTLELCAEKMNQLHETDHYIVYVVD